MKNFTVGIRLWKCTRCRNRHRGRSRLIFRAAKCVAWKRSGIGLLLIQSEQNHVEGYLCFPFRGKLHSITKDLWDDADTTQQRRMASLAAAGAWGVGKLRTEARQSMLG